MFVRLTIVCSILCFAFQAFGQNANDDIVAAYLKLDQVKSYKIRTTMSSGNQFAKEMEQAKQMGMDMEMKPILQEVVNPNLRKMSMDLPLLSMSGMPNLQDMEQMAKNMPKSPKGMPTNMPPMPQMQLKAYRVKMYAVSDGSGIATYLDCQQWQKDIDDSMRQQLKQMMEQLTSNLLHSILGGPQAMITAVADEALAATMGKAMMEGATAKAEKMMSLNQWTCRDVKIQKPDKTSPPNFTNAKAMGDAKVGEEAAKAYQFTVVDENSQKEMPVKLYVSAASGLPLRMEMSQPQGSVTMEYYDVDAPTSIEVPDCMKK